MDNVRLFEAEYRIQHRHNDGTWGDMEEEDTSARHDPAQSDPERRWGVDRIFRCKSCEQQVTIVHDDRPADEA